MASLTLETKKDILRDFLLEAADGDFLKWLEGNGYFTAPASKSHHGSEEGALYEHSLQVAYELINLTEKLGLKWQRKNSPQIIGMLHDVCKMDDYLIREEVIGATIDGGKIYGNPQVEWNKERIWPGHGEKSLIMLMGHINLTEEEKMCIRYHMGSFTESKEWQFYSRAVKIYPNVLYTHMADMIASQIKGV